MVALRRGFLGIVPPPPVLDAVDGLLARGKSRRFRWTRREQWHITLQYYGRVGDGDALVAGLTGACAKLAPVRLQLRGGGAFGSPKRAQVLWLGVHDNDALAYVHEAVMESTGRFVARRDRVAFLPHLTLARLKSTTDLTADVDALGAVPVGPPWDATEVVLFDSDTRSSGAVYTEIARVAFGQPSDQSGA